jgi:hypothetical protein
MGLPNATSVNQEMDALPVWPATYACSEIILTKQQLRMQGGGLQKAAAAHGTQQQVDHGENIKDVTGCTVPPPR